MVLKNCNNKKTNFISLLDCSLLGDAQQAVHLEELEQLQRLVVVEVEGLDANPWVVRAQQQSPLHRLQNIFFKRKLVA